MRLQTAMIFVKDFPRMKAFYTDVLRATPVNTEWEEQWALFDTGGVNFALHAIPPEAAAGIVIPTPPRPRETDPVKLTFSTVDVPAERARLEAIGVTLIQRSWQQPDEGFEAVDPEGNIFQVVAA